eukprot:TRINITY_DN5224_c0_g1_i1.p1 TRINITY_DN5224_c0_g1~~TRINITY_DN5224_c0_g1_i1.p1  ORF type:complete len:388 (-),score=155.23 TRINITY_DN5224_c0_g1_i1:78-1241(-)
MLSASNQLIALRRLGSVRTRVSNELRTRCLAPALVQVPAVTHRYLATRTQRTLASYNFSHASFEDQWPVGVTNTVLNVCPQGERMVVERLGKLLKVENSGWFFAIPGIDKIAYKVDMRERTIAINPQSAITKDNVSVQVSGNLYVQFVDAEKAAYGSTNPLYSVRQFAQSSMRSALGELELDEILHARAKLNKMIGAAVQDAAMAWGLQVKRYEITEITPDTQISEAMDRQAAAERVRRERVLTAEGEKRAAQLQSEGVKLQLINESEGALIKVQNEARAAKDRIVLEAEGHALAVKLAADAQAKALEVIAEALNREGGAEAAQLAVAKQYIEMYGDMGQKSNTMLFSERPADVSHLLAQAATVLNATLKERPPAPALEARADPKKR